MSIQRFSKSALAAAALAFCACQALADVKLPRIFGDNMVLQQGVPINVWGWANPGQTVKVSFDGESAETKATEKGEWKLTLPARKASADGAKFTVKGDNEIVLDNVLVGEVWLCSGQSNMEMGVGMSGDKETEIPAADNPSIRLFLVPHGSSPRLQKDIMNEKAKWKVCSPSTILEGGWNGFSAAGYYFGKTLNKELKVPVGLIEAAIGGTRIEPWTAPAGFGEVPALAALYKRTQMADLDSPVHKTAAESLLKQTARWQEVAAKALAENEPIPNMPDFPKDFNATDVSGFSNSMIGPLAPFQIRGAIWYQGEANVTEGMEYFEKCKALIAGWRKLWSNPSLPVYIAQIAPFNYGADKKFAEPALWEAEYAVTKAVPNTGIASTMDIGNVKDIHPQNKKEIGRRLAVQALVKTYGEMKDVEPDSPSFKSLSVDGAKLRVEFDNVPTTLVSRDGKPLDFFELYDPAKDAFVPAKAEIDGKSVLVSAEGVAKPSAVRFGWNQLAEPNLSSAEGLPAYPFRAGEMNRPDVLSGIPEAKDFKLVYEMNLLNAPLAYSVDKSAEISGAFDRIAYVVELKDKGSDDTVSSFVYVSIPAFSNDVKKIGVPLHGAGVFAQELFEGMNVRSNVKEIVSGDGLKGNIEFWPCNYSPENALKIPGANERAYDFDDTPAADKLSSGYASMQIHNYVAKQTLFAFNNIHAGSRADLGIGNCKKGAPDWTFANNAETYDLAKIRVLVHLK